VTRTCATSTAIVFPISAISRSSATQAAVVGAGQRAGSDPARWIHIRDTAPVIVAAAEGVELTERVWAPRGPNKKPVFNFRSEKRSFAKSLRCLIPATHFVEFTTPADPKQKRKDKWRFTLAGAEWFCIAGSSGRMRSTSRRASPC
jgi:Uncharacterized conserved protein